MKIKTLLAKMMFAVCLFVATATVLTSCNNEKDDNKDGNHGNQGNQPAKVELTGTEWVADTSWTVPSIPGVPIPINAIDFTSTLNFATATDGLYTIKLDLLGRTDTLNYTYTFDGEKGGTLTTTSYTASSIPFTYDKTKINIRITKDLIPGADTSTMLSMAFAAIEANGGLSFNYYKK